MLFDHVWIGAERGEGWGRKERRGEGGREGGNEGMSTQLRCSKANTLDRI
jgi:hypothetical protein